MYVQSTYGVYTRNKQYVRGTRTVQREGSTSVGCYAKHQSASYERHEAFPHPRYVLVARVARVDGRVRVRQHVDGRLPVLLAGGPQRPHGGKVPGPTGSLLAAAKFHGGAPAI